MRPLVVFRADASPQVGGGHVLRCLTLANKLAESGCDIGFACSPETLAIVPGLQGHDVLQVTGQVDRDVRSLREKWSRGASILFVDHYELHSTFETRCRDWAARVAAIDDLANRAHDCDLLLDPTFGRTVGDYERWVPETALLLVGSEFALLRPEFVAERAVAAKRRQSASGAQRLLVSLGLTDIGGRTGAIVDALLGCTEGIQIDAVVGGSAPSKPDLQQRAATDPRVRLHVDTSDMARIMAEADLAVGAAGSTSWERCCVGLPSVLLVVADNQRTIADRLQAAGAAVVLPGNAPAQDVAQACASMLGSPPTLQRMSRAAMTLVDGRGAGRVSRTVMALLENQTELPGRLHLRPPTISDSPLVWQWRNDIDSRRAFRNSDPVPHEQHDRWFANVIADEQRVVWIGVVCHLPVGVVRFERLAQQEYEVSINVAPQMRGKGLGTVLLGAACSALEREYPAVRIRAEIKVWNQASRRIFEACDFECDSEDSEFRKYRRVPRRRKTSECSAT